MLFVTTANKMDTKLLNVIREEEMDIVMIVEVITQVKKFVK